MLPDYIKNIYFQLRNNDVACSQCGVMALLDIVNDNDLHVVMHCICQNSININNNYMI